MIPEAAKDNLKRDLANNEANFSSIRDTAALLENRTIKAIEVWSLLSKIYDVLQVDSQMKTKFDSILKRNAGLN